MKRSSVLRLLAAVVLLALVLAGVQLRRAAALRQEAQQAARRGAAWLSALTIPLKDPAIPWIIGVIDAEYCQDPRVHQYVAQRFTEFTGRRHPIYIALRALALGTKHESFDAFQQRWQKLGSRGDEILAMAWGAYCDRLPLPDAIARVVRSTSSKGYDLTHQYIALQLMKQNGCLAPEDEKTLAWASRTIADELRSDAVFSDLWAERLAVLLYADQRRLVKSAWIETLIAAQEPSGAWSDPNFPKRFYKTSENPHTTVLAVWALAEHSRTCPF